MNKREKSVIWLLLLIFLIVVFLASGTYAYFATKDFYHGNFDVEVETKGVDTLEFDTGKSVEIKADVSNFTQGIGSDVSGNTTIDVKLHTTKDTAKYCYEIMMQLPEKEIFSYSKDENTPELLLTIENSSDGINYTKVIDKMDITTKTGKIMVPVSKGSNEYIHEISAIKNIEKISYWNAQITLVWLADVDQKINDLKKYNATFKANIIDC